MKDYLCKCGHLYSDHNNKKHPCYNYQMKYNCCLEVDFEGICSCLKCRRNNGKMLAMFIDDECKLLMCLKKDEVLV